MLTALRGESTAQRDRSLPPPTVAALLGCRGGAGFDDRRAAGFAAAGGLVESGDKILLAVAASEDDWLVGTAAGGDGDYGDGVGTKLFERFVDFGRVFRIVAVHRDGARAGDRLLDRLRAQHCLLKELAVEAPLGGEVDEHRAAFIDGDLLELFKREWLPGHVG